MAVGLHFRMKWRLLCQLFVFGGTRVAEAGEERATQINEPRLFPEEHYSIATQAFMNPGCCT